MEVERLVKTLRGTIDAVKGSSLMDDYFDADFEAMIKTAQECPIQLNRRRTVATVAKMLVDAGEEQAAGVLVQMFGSGEPYEVEE